MIDSVSETTGTGHDFKNSRRQKTLAERGAVTLDRLPPHDPKMEMGVLGCILISPNECLPECIQKLGKSGADSFYDLRHQTIYGTMIAMYAKMIPIDLVTLQQNLKDRQLLEQIGGISYLLELDVPSAANLSYYLEIVREKYILRQTILTCSGVVGRIYEYEGEVPALMDEVESSLASINAMRLSTDVLDTKGILQQSINQIEHRYNTKGACGGLLTGLMDIDNMLGGIKGGEMVVIAARPSVGKSSLMMDWATNIFLEQNLPVGIFSLEMSAVSLITRSTGSIARVNMLRPWEWSQIEFERVTVAQGRINKAAHLLQIDDGRGMSILELKARARRMAAKHGIKALCIDYLQLLKGHSRKAESNRQVEIAEISQGIKELAGELNIPVVVLSQLNRELEKTQRKPRLADLRESGSIEQDADVIGLLSKKIVDEDDDGQEQVGIPMIFDIAKQRNGPTGEVYLTFLKPFTRFESAPKFRSEDVPQHHPD